jgi:protein HIRA/HIR1
MTKTRWSPEGARIVAPNSMNGPVFVASVIQRLDWASHNSMVGHENVVEVVVRLSLLSRRI